MAVGDPGKEQFLDLIPRLRNRHIAAGMSPLMLLREELSTNDDFQDRGGMDDITVTHFLRLLINADMWRRRLTFNPDGGNLGDKIAKAIDSKTPMSDADNPFGGDDIQMQSLSLYDLPWDFSGADKNLPLLSQLELPSTNAIILLGAVDSAIVAWTRLNSRGRSMFITREDSMRIYGWYQQILAYLQTFGGTANRVDVAQVRAVDEPTGRVPNRRDEDGVVAKK